MANPVVSTYLDWLALEDTNAQQQVRTYRSYYEGDHPTLLTDRQAAYLNVDRNKNFGANCTAVIVDAVRERLDVTGFDVRPIVQEKPKPMEPVPPAEPFTAEGDKPEDKAEEKKPDGDKPPVDPLTPGVSPPADAPLPPAPKAPEEILAELCDTWWQKNRMDASQDWLYQAALRDRESFIIVGYDAEEERPSLSYDFAYDGTAGVKAHNVPGTYNKLAFASKRWVVDGGAGAGKMRRLNLYFPNRIEKWVNKANPDGKYSEAFWQPLYPDPDDPTVKLVTVKDGEKTYQAAVAWWTDNGEESGKPLGVPVIPFRNRDDGTGRGLSEIDNAIPFQDGINKFFLDLMAAGDMTGFGMYWTNGQGPDGGFKVYPGAMLPVTPFDNDSGSAQIGALPAGDLSQLIAGLNAIVGLMAGVTGTPQSRFTPSVVRPSADTQKQEESPLVSKVKGLQKVWGNSWEDVMQMALKVERTFGSSSVPDTEGLTISTQWKDAEIRNEAEHINTIATKVEKLKVPVEQGWQEAGYSADQIRDFKAEKEKREAYALEIQRASVNLLPANTMTRPAGESGPKGSAPSGPPGAAPK